MLLGAPGGPSSGSTRFSPRGTRAACPPFLGAPLAVKERNAGHVDRSQQREPLLGALLLPLGHLLLRHRHHKVHARVGVALLDPERLLLLG